MAPGKWWVLGCALLLVGSSPALAEPPPGTRLSYTRAPGAESCPDEQGFRDMVAAQMGGDDPFTSDGARRLDVTLSRRGRGFRGALVLVDGAGHPTRPRELSGATCGALVDDLALSISIALRVFPRPSAPAPPPPSPPPPTLADSPRPAPPEPASLALRLGAGGAVGLGVSPANVAPGVAVDVGLRWPRWAPLSLALEGRAYPSATGMAEGGGARVTTGLYTGALVPCAYFRVVDHLELAGCALVELGALRVTSDADHPSTAVLFHAATGLRGGIEVPLIDHLALRATGDGLVSLRRYRGLVGGQPAWTEPLVSAGFGLGAVVSF